MRYINRILTWLLLAPLLLPVVIYSPVIYPYLVPKTLLFYAISLVSLASFLILICYGHQFYWARLRSRITWIPVALLIVAYGTSLVGIDFYRSLWSLMVRGDGLLMLTGVVTSFYLIVLSADAHFYRRLVGGVAIIASFVALYGIGEWLLAHGRIGSLLGNAAFFAGYLGIAFFVTLLAAQGLRGGTKRLAHVGAALQIIAIILTATRGTILALAFSLVVYLVYATFSLRGVGRTRAAQGLVALILIGGAFVALRGSLSTFGFQPVARVASISTSDNDVASRLFIWSHMITEIKMSPWLGVGAEHIDVLFNRFYDPSQIVEQWFDRSHNAFLDYAAQYGIGGLLLYLALIGAYFITAARFARRGDRATATLTALLALTYAVQNFFVFDTISSLWLFVAMLAVLMSQSLPDATRERLPLPSWMQSASWLIALFLIALIYPVSIKPAEAAYDLAQAYTYTIADVPTEVSYLSHGFALMTYANLEYGYEAYDMYANTQATKLSGDARAQAYQATVSILTTNFNRFTYDARTALYLAHTLSLAPADASVDQALLSAALTRAIQLSPKRAQPWYILTNLSLGSANQNPPQSAARAAGYAAAEDIMNKYIAMVPTLSLPHYVLADLYLAAGDTKNAAAEAALGKRYYQSDLETATRAVGYYETVLDLPDAAYFLKEILTFEPDNAAATADLTKIEAYENAKQ